MLGIGSVYMVRLSCSLSVFSLRVGSPAGIPFVSITLPHIHSSHPSCLRPYMVPQLPSQRDLTREKISRSDCRCKSRGSQRYFGASISRLDSLMMVRRDDYGEPLPPNGEAHSSIISQEKFHEKNARARAERKKKRARTVAGSTMPVKVHLGRL